MEQGLHRFLAPILLTGAFALAGCASTPPGPRSDDDPFEPFNRSMHNFNEALDRTILKPVDKAYQFLPQRLRRGIGNFFNNLQDAWSVPNALLQLKGRVAGENLTRFWVNTFFGIGGIFDVATEMQIPRQVEDFGQVLGYWGVPEGPYIVAPLLGPFTLRDMAAYPVDWVYGLAPIGWTEWGDSVRVQNTVGGIRFFHLRAVLQQQQSVLETVSMDKYTLYKNVYMQYRRYLVNDGMPVEDVYEEDVYDEELYDDEAAPEVETESESETEIETGSESQGGQE